MNSEEQAEWLDRDHIAQPSWIDEDICGYCGFEIEMDTEGEWAHRETI